MEERIAQVARGVKPSVISWCSAAVGAALSWWTGLPLLAQALLIAQGADVVSGLMCALAGRSEKTQSGRVSSGALTMGVAKKGLEWLAVLVCVQVGAALQMEGIGGAAMTYMMATELVSLIENLRLFGLEVPALDRILDVARGGQDRGGERREGD